MIQGDLLHDLVALQREVLTPWTCWYGQRAILGQTIAFGWFGKHHCVFCCVETESD